MSTSAPQEACMPLELVKLGAFAVQRAEMGSAVISLQVAIMTRPLWCLSVTIII